MFIKFAEKIELALYTNEGRLPKDIFATMAWPTSCPPSLASIQDRESSKFPFFSDSKIP